MRFPGLLILAFQGLGWPATAQEHPFLGAYELSELEGRIRVSWTILGGSTCNGQSVERSLDSTTFVTVYAEEGICGDVSVPIPYEWIDAAPPELSTLYYRIKLGLDGYSSVRSVHFDQLTSADHRLYPSPTQGDARLVLKIAPGTPVDLLLMDAAGHRSWEAFDLPGPSVELDLAGLAPGVYIYRATAAGRIFTGRFVLE